MGGVTQTNQNQVSEQTERNETMKQTYQISLHNSTPENCEKVIETFLKDIPKIDPGDIRFDRALSLASRFVHKSRPIMVKYYNYTDRRCICIKSYDDKIKEKL